MKTQQSELDLLLGNNRPNIVHREPVAAATNNGAVDQNDFESEVDIFDDELPDTFDLFDEPTVNIIDELAESSKKPKSAQTVLNSLIEKAAPENRSASPAPVPQSNGEEQEASEEDKEIAELQAKLEAKLRKKKEAAAQAKKQAEEEAAAKEKAKVKAEVEAKAKEEAKEKAIVEAMEIEEAAELQAKVEAKLRKKKEAAAAEATAAQAKKQAEEEAVAQQKAKVKAEAEAKAKEEAKEKAIVEAMEREMAALEAEKQRRAAVEAKEKEEAKAKAIAEAKEKEMAALEAEKQRLAAVEAEKQAAAAKKLAAEEEARKQAAAAKELEIQQSMMSEEAALRQKLEAMQRELEAEKAKLAQATAAATAAAPASTSKTASPKKKSKKMRKRSSQKSDSGSGSYSGSYSGSGSYSDSYEETESDDRESLQLPVVRKLRSEKASAKKLSKKAAKKRRNMFIDDEVSVSGEVRGSGSGDDEDDGELSNADAFIAPEDDEEMPSVSSLRALANEHEMAEEINFAKKRRIEKKAKPAPATFDALFVEETKKPALDQTTLSDAMKWTENNIDWKAKAAEMYPDVQLDFCPEMLLSEFHILVRIHGASLGDKADPLFEALSQRVSPLLPDRNTASKEMFQQRASCETGIESMVMASLTGCFEVFGRPQPLPDGLTNIATHPVITDPSAMENLHELMLQSGDLKPRLGPAPVGLPIVFEQAAKAVAVGPYHHLYNNKKSVEMPVASAGAVAEAESVVPMTDEDKEIEEFCNDQECIADDEDGDAATVPAAEVIKTSYYFDGLVRQGSDEGVFKYSIEDHLRKCKADMVLKPDAILAHLFDLRSNSRAVNPLLEWALSGLDVNTVLREQDFGAVQKRRERSMLVADIGTLLLFAGSPRSSPCGKLVEQTKQKLDDPEHFDPDQSPSWVAAIHFLFGFISTNALLDKSDSKCELANVSVVRPPSDAAPYGTADAVFLNKNELPNSLALNFNSEKRSVLRMLEAHYLRLIGLTDFDSETLADDWLCKRAEFVRSAKPPLSIALAYPNEELMVQLAEQSGHSKQIVTHMMADIEKLLLTMNRALFVLLI